MQINIDTTTLVVQHGNSLYVKIPFWLHDRKGIMVGNILKVKFIEVINGTENDEKDCD